VTDRLLTLQECADRTATSLAWWRKAVFQRSIPVVHVGRLVRIAERDLKAFIEANRSEAKPVRDDQGQAKRVVPAAARSTGLRAVRQRGSP
jgi:excisionase family DNA binding protein